MLKQGVWPKVPEGAVGLGGSPDWWHLKGHDVKVTTTVAGLIIITASGAMLRIEWFAPDDYAVKWRIVPEALDVIEGRLQFEADELKAAFGLTELSGAFGDHLITRYGAESAEQGRFIRWKRFLNIPGPGTGGQGDPNISIYLTDEIRDAVKHMIAEHAPEIVKEEAIPF